MNFYSKCGQFCTKRSLIKPRGELSPGKSHFLFQGQANLQIIYSNLIAEHLYFTDEELGHRALKWGGLGVSCSRSQRKRWTNSGGSNTKTTSLWSFFWPASAMPSKEAVPCIWLTCRLRPSRTAENPGGWDKHGMPWKGCKDLKWLVMRITCTSSVIKIPGVVDTGSIGTNLESGPSAAELRSSEHCPRQQWREGEKRWWGGALVLEKDLGRSVGTWNARKRRFSQLYAMILL